MLSLPLIIWIVGVLICIPGVFAVDKVFAEGSMSDDLEKTIGPTLMASLLWPAILIIAIVVFVFYGMFLIMCWVLNQIKNLFLRHTDYAKKSKQEKVLRP